ncbi:hypothetical protein HS088_TW06G01222 [Tripterygium wilfordii]|uniref:Cold regulated protein 27 n=1 Tax=Tripterygium wilfordii TaxID=458696 RepID=A0A7J7DL04_TRIWF|nr:cold-regulated protein 27-like [Tripterygium wilfordii]KAF5747045.1 hypothetical protein HS088_TW06G01222 [Tripterygium wilfordii]
MEENFRRSEILENLETSESSAIDSSELSQQEETASRDSPMVESLSTEWTDEKHSLYLKFMEASFVDQLYTSPDVLGRHSGKEKSDLKLPRQRYSDNPASNGQYKVFRGGCWQKMNFERPEPAQSVSDESHGFLASPWIQHFRQTCKPEVLATPNILESSVSERLAVNLSGEKAVLCASDTNSKQPHVCLDSHPCHIDLVGSITEVSDQNFVDNDTRGEKQRSKCSTKRMRTVSTTTLSSDQVVPHSRPSGTENRTKKYVSQAKQRATSTAEQ